MVDASAGSGVKPTHFTLLEFRRPPCSIRRGGDAVGSYFNHSRFFRLLPGEAGV